MSNCKIPHTITINRGYIYIYIYIYKINYDQSEGIYIYNDHQAANISGANNII